jgi:hypothetical protein
MNKPKDKHHPILPPIDEAPTAHFQSKICLVSAKSFCSLLTSAACGEFSTHNLKPNTKVAP